MKGFDKFLLCLMAVIVMVVCVAFGMLALQWPFSVSFWQQLVACIDNTTAAIVVGAVALAVFLICLRMFFAIQQKREPEVRSALVSQTEIGGTFITLAAIDSMVQKHIRQNNRVRDCVTAVRAAQDGVVLSARLTVLPDTQLVELTGALQKSLKEYIETLCGIRVLEVGILIESTASGAGRVD